MKKSLLLIIAISIFLLTSCNNQPIKLTQDKAANIAYHYAQQIYRDATFYLGINNYLNKNGQDMEVLKQIAFYIEGYKLGLTRQDIYDDVQEVIYFWLGKYYNKKDFDMINKVIMESHEIPFLLSDFIAAGKINDAKVREISEKLNKLAIVLCFNEAEDQQTFYEALIHPQDFKYANHDLDKLRYFSGILADIHEIEDIITAE